MWTQADLWNVFTFLRASSLSLDWICCTDVSGLLSVHGNGVDVGVGAGSFPAAGQTTFPRMETIQEKPRIATAISARSVREVAAFSICLLFILSLNCFSVKYVALLDKERLNTGCCA